MSYDKQLYNRQEYAVGTEAQAKISAADVLLIGLSGTGCEIAKNLVLTGIRSITLRDHARVSYMDLATLFFAGENDIGAPRVAVVTDKLAELNPYVTIRSQHPGAALHGLTPEELSAYSVVVVVDQPYSSRDVLALNALCRSLGIAFVLAETRGLCAALFVDFGDNFTVLDRNGEDYPTCLVNAVTAEGAVLCHEDQRHGLEEGDVVMFHAMSGELEGLLHKEWVVKQVTTPHNFVLDLGGRMFGCDAYDRRGTVRGVKKSVVMKFRCLEQNIADPSYVYSDLGKFDAPPQLHAYFRALHRYQEHNQRLPQAGSEHDAQSVVQLMKELAPDLEFDSNLFMSFAMGACGSFAGISTLIGGIAAHEILKGATGKFTPIQQFYFFDAREMISSAKIPSESRKAQSCRYDAQIAIFGAEAQQKFLRQSLFLVGAGALGCELIKNFALCGLGCSPEGRIVVTDMDTIEKSNLSRQFLFRNSDIGKAKSICASKKGREMNPHLNMYPMQDKVGEGTEDTFHDHFWSSLSGVCTALDNVVARTYVDGECVAHRLPMFDSGTLGCQANAQVVIPHLTESYASSSDPPEKSIPVCTLKNFPSQIEHTIQWARECFEGEFVTRMRELHGYLTDVTFIRQLDKEPGTKPEILQGIAQSLRCAPSSIEDCIVFARHKFQEFFFNQPAELLHNFPVDSTTPSGAPFWIGPKRAPIPLLFDPNNELHVDFVESAAHLRACNYGLSAMAFNCTRTHVARVAAEATMPSFQPRKMRIQTEPDDNTVSHESNAEKGENSVKLPDASLYSVLSEQLCPIEFEKDNDENHHIAFVTACSNLRATCYGIETANFDRTKLIAGRIIPAMVTTTAAITGVVLMELMKHIILPSEDHTLTRFRNAFLNLALGFTTFSDPLAPRSTTYGPPSDPKKHRWTLWDRIIVCIGRELSLREFLDFMQKEHGLEISMMSCGTCIVYSCFSAASKVRMEKLLSCVVEEVSKKPLPSHGRYLQFEAMATIEDEDVDIPPIRYQYRF